MTEGDRGDAVRLARVLNLSSREAEQLLGARKRLLENVQEQDITEHWLDERLTDPPHTTITGLLFRRQQVDLTIASRFTRIANQQITST